MKRINCILLIDDNKDDNFFHERTIRKFDATTRVVTRELAKDGLKYLRHSGSEDAPRPDLIFLDINMPGMNGWEFLKEYRELEDSVKSTVIVVMLTTSDNPDDKEQAMVDGIVADFRTKPLTISMLEDIVQKFF